MHETFASLVSVKDPKHSCALEICAGGRLYNIVVANEQTASQLLDQNTFQRRVTFIPLNKIVPFTIPQYKIDRTKSSYEGFVELASNLVAYDDRKIQPAVDYVLGGCFVCSNKETAKKIAFEQKCRAITLDGDIYDPSGTLTGGSRRAAENRNKDAQSPFNFAVLSKLVAEDTRKLQQIDSALSGIKTEIDSLQSLAKELSMKRENIVFLKKQLNAIVVDAEEKERLQNILQSEKEVK